MSEIFISYARADREKARQLAEVFQSKGWSVWWDRAIPPGRTFDEVIEEALNTTKCVVVLWSRSSVASTWVKSEATEGAKRSVLVPALIENVAPPLEFRRTQAANLIAWNGSADDAELLTLLSAVGDVLAQPATDSPHSEGRVRVAAEEPKPLLPGFSAMNKKVVMIGAVGLLLLGATAVFLALSHWGPIGGGDSAVTRELAVAGKDRGSADKPSPAGTAVATGSAQNPRGNADQSAPAAPQSGRVNLLDPEEGGKLVIASEGAWQRVTAKNLDNTIIATHGFAVFAFKDEKPAQFDTLAVYIAQTDGYNLKELSLYAGDESENGPFRRIAQITVPNYRNMRTPFHEFRFERARARFFKVELVSWQDDGRPNGNVGNMQLFGTLP